VQQTSKGDHPVLYDAAIIDGSVIRASWAALFLRNGRKVTSYSDLGMREKVSTVVESAAPKFKSLGYAKSSAGSSEDHTYGEPEQFSATTPLGIYASVSEQVKMSKTPEDHRYVLSLREWYSPNGYSVSCPCTCL
jgi:hypothetical protein